MPSEDLANLDLTQVSKLLAQRALSATELLDDVLRRTAQLQPALNPFITVMADEARSDAERADRERAQGHVRGPLHGVPVSLKDLFAMNGVPTTAGSSILRDWIPDYDATVTERLQEAGAVIFAKANLHEFALGTTNDNPHFGPARNPWDTSRIPGGSSGGSGVAVAAGLGYASIGTDTGGSIRRPAAFCGVVGLKPTYGRISRFGMLPAAWSLDTAGPLTRSVRDAALVLDVLAGQDPADPTSSPRPVEAYTPAATVSLRSRRVGVPHAFVGEDVDPQVERSYWAAVAVLEQLGAERIDLDLPSAEYAAVASTAISGAEVAAAHRRWLPGRLGEYGPGERGHLAVSLSVTAGEYIRAQQARRAIGARLADDLRRVDVIVSPTIATPAPLISEGSAALRDRPSDVCRRPHVFNRLVSLLGLPSISVPCGFSDRGLPYGLQIVGKPFDERGILEVAAAYEAATSWHSRRPPAIARPIGS